MKEEFESVEIELVLFSTDVIKTSPDDGFWLPTDKQSVSIGLGS